MYIIYIIYILYNDGILRNYFDQLFDRVFLKILVPVDSLGPGEWELPRQVIKKFKKILHDPLLF